MFSDPCNQYGDEKWPRLECCWIRSEIAIGCLSSRNLSCDLAVLIFFVELVSVLVPEIYWLRITLLRIYLYLIKSHKQCVTWEQNCIMNIKTRLYVRYCKGFNSKQNIFSWIQIITKVTFVKIWIQEILTHYVNQLLHVVYVRHVTCRYQDKSLPWFCAPNIIVAYYFLITSERVEIGLKSLSKKKKQKVLSS